MGIKGDLKTEENEEGKKLVIPRRYERNRCRDSFRPSSIADRRSRGYGPHRRWQAETVGEEEQTEEVDGRMGPTSGEVGAEPVVAAASSCKVVEPGIAGSFVEPYQVLQAASSS